VFFQSVSSYLLDLFFPQYSVGYFVLKIPSCIAHDILKLQEYCDEEQVDYFTFFKYYLNLLNNRDLDESDFVSTKFIKRNGINAYLDFSKYYDILKTGQFKSFLPFWWKIDKSGAPKLNKGDILIYTLVAFDNVKFNQIKNRKDLKENIKKVTESCRDPNSVLFYFIKFQTSSSEEISILDGYAIAPNG
jgi:hypothetical protein